jgi:hypothetical protein
MEAQSMPSQQSQRADRERLAAVERDVAYLGDQFGLLSRRVDEGFSHLEQTIRQNRTPVAAMSGWAAVVLTLVGAIVYPLMQADARHHRRMDRIEELHRSHVEDGHAKKTNRNTRQIESLMSEALRAAEERGRLDERTTQMR